MKKQGQRPGTVPAGSCRKLPDNALKESIRLKSGDGEGYTDCVAYVNGESVSVVIAGTDNGLENADIAKVTDIVLERPGLRLIRSRLWRQIKDCFLRSIMVQY